MTQSFRDRVPLEMDYATAIGQTLYIWLRTEWQAVWCVEKMRPGTIGALSGRTAGGVAKALRSCAAEAPKSLKVELEPMVDRFGELVKKRDKIAHGRPVTAPNGEQRLSHKGSGADFLSIELLNQWADEFAECGHELNRFYYKVFGR